MTSTSALLDGNKAILDCVAQVPGDGLAIKREILREEMARDPALNTMMHAYQNVTISQLAQTAACNRLHTLEQRCCRWLLTAHDSAGSDTFELTHEFLSMMLGVRGPASPSPCRACSSPGSSNTPAAGSASSIASTSSGESCECYASIRAVINRSVRSRVANPCHQRPMFAVRNTSADGEKHRPLFAIAQTTSPPTVWIVR